MRTLSVKMKNNPFVRILKNHYGKIVLVLFLSWFLPTEYHNFTGYCRAEGRYLEKQELIDRAVQKYFVRESEEVRNEAFYYASLEEFYKKNPDCCKVVSLKDGEEGEDGNYMNGLSSLFGSKIYKVTINHFKKDKEEMRSAKTIILVDQCANYNTRIE